MRKRILVMVVMVRMRPMRRMLVRERRVSRQSVRMRRRVVLHPWRSAIRVHRITRRRRTDDAMPVAMRMCVCVAVAVRSGAGEDVVLVRAAPGVVVTPSELVDRRRRLRRWIEVHCCVAEPLAASDSRKGDSEA